MTGETQRAKLPRISEDRITITDSHRPPCCARRAKAGWLWVTKKYADGSASRRTGLMRWTARLDGCLGRTTYSPDDDRPHHAHLPAGWRTSTTKPPQPTRPATGRDRANIRRGSLYDVLYDNPHSGFLRQPTSVTWALRGRLAKLPACSRLCWPAMTAHDRFGDQVTTGAREEA